MKTYWHASEEIKKWRLEKEGENSLRVLPDVGKVYPLRISSMEHGGCLTDIDPFIYRDFDFHAVYGGFRNYLCDKMFGRGPCFFSFDRGERKVKKYRVMEMIFPKDERAILINFPARLSTLEMSGEEEGEAMQLLKNAGFRHLLPNEEWLRMKNLHGAARVLGEAVRTHKFRGVSQRKGDISYCDLGVVM